MAVAAPLTPWPRVTIYEALPFYPQMFLEGTRLSAYPNSSHAISDLELDYELVCKIMNDLELDGQMEISLRRALRSATPSMVIG